MTDQQKKQRARREVANALRQGWLVRPQECEKCGRSHKRIEAHHPSYDQPLAVEWLCRPCHGMAHGHEPGQGHVAVCVRVDPEKRARLMEIGKELGHKNLSQTLNLVCKRLVEQYLRGEVEEAA